MSPTVRSIVTGLAFLPVLHGASIVHGQPLRETSVLVVTAHPDDEALFGSLVYRTAIELGGSVDLAVVTDGAGGYRFATLAERLYGLELTDPGIARQYLPAIRKSELLAGGRMVGFRKYHFLDQPDTGRTTDPDSVLGTVWDSSYVLQRLKNILERSRYDFVLTFLPREDQHGHHKAAAILSLRAVAAMQSAEKPVLLGCWISEADNDKPLVFGGLAGYPEASTTSRESLFQFDRRQAMPANPRLNYKIPVNWLIAEHKSQGTMQLFLNRGDVEEYWLYRQNPPDALDRARSFFQTVNRFETRPDTSVAPSN